MVVFVRHFRVRPRHSCVLVRRVVAGETARAGVEWCSASTEAGRRDSAPPGVARGRVARRGRGGGHQAARGRGRAYQVDGGAPAAPLTLIAADERSYIVQTWRNEVCYRVAQHASSARPLQLHTTKLMNDVLTASEATSSEQAAGDGGAQMPGALSEDGGDVGMTAASVDSPDRPDMTLKGLGRDTAALCRVIKAAMEMHRSAQAAHERTGTSAGQVNAEIEALIVARAAGWKLTMEQSRDVLKWAHGWKTTPVWLAGQWRASPLTPLRSARRAPGHAILPGSRRALRR